MSERAGKSSNLGRLLWERILNKRPRSWTAIVGVWGSRPLNWLYVLCFLLLFCVCGVPWSSEWKSDAFRNAHSLRPSGAVVKPADLRKASRDPQSVAAIDLSFALPNGPSAVNPSAVNPSAVNNDRFSWSADSIASMSGLSWLKMDRRQLHAFSAEAIEQLSGVTTLHICDKWLDSGDLELISQWVGVTHLELETDVFPASLVELSALPNLQRLVLRATTDVKGHSGNNDGQDFSEALSQLRTLDSLADLAIVAKAIPVDGPRENEKRGSKRFYTSVVSALSDHPSLQRFWIGEIRDQDSPGLLDSLQVALPGISVAHARFNVGTVYRSFFLCFLLSISSLLILSNFTLQMTISQARLLPGYHPRHSFISLLYFGLVASLVATDLVITNAMSLPSALALTSLVAFLTIATNTLFVAMLTAAAGSWLETLAKLAPMVVVVAIIMTVSKGMLFSSHFLADLLEILAREWWLWSSCTVVIAWAAIVVCMANDKNQTVVAHEKGLVSQIFDSPFSNNQSVTSKQVDTPFRWSSPSELDRRLRGASRDSWIGRVRLIWMAECQATPASLLRSSPWLLIGYLPVALFSLGDLQPLRYFGLMIGLFLAMGVVVCMVAGNDQLKNEIMLPRSKSDLFNEKLSAGALHFLSTIGTAGLAMIAYQWYASESLGLLSVLMKLIAVVSCLVFLCALKMWFSTVNLWGAAPLILIGIVGVAVLGTIMMMGPNGNMAIPRSGLTEVVGSRWVAPAMLLISVAMIYGAKGRWMSTEFTQL